MAVAADAARAVRDIAGDHHAGAGTDGRTIGGDAARGRDPATLDAVHALALAIADTFGPIAATGARSVARAITDLRQG